MIATINLIRSSSAVASDNQAYRLNQPTPPLERHRKMKHLLITTIAAVLLVGCGESQQSAPAPETPTVEPVAEVVKPEPPTVKPEHPQANRALIEATATGNVEAIKKSHC